MHPGISGAAPRSIVAGRAAQIITNTAFRMFPDAPAAGSKEGAAPAQSAESIAFTNLMRGIHFQPGPREDYMKRIAIVIALALFAAPAVAQKKMYRCGNVFQERPCEGPKQGAKEEAAKAAAPAKTQSASASRLAAQKEIRCENFGRQRADLEQKKRAMKDADSIKAMDAQIGAVEKRMREDGC